MCCIRVYHGNALLIPIQVCTVCVFIYLFIYFMSLPLWFSKDAAGRCQHCLCPFVATSKTAVIANCPDFKQMHNIRTTIKLGAV